MIPEQLFLTKGVGRHKNKLVSLELALREAGIAQYNLVKVTSIVPPGCTIISREEGVKLLSPGEIVFCVMGESSTDEPRRMLSAAIGLAIPKERDRHGYILEHNSFDQEAQEAGSYAESLAVEMLVTSDPDRYDQLADTFTTTSIAQTAISEDGGMWTTVVAVVVFVPANRKE